METGSSATRGRPMRLLMRPRSCRGVRVWMNVGSATSLEYATPKPTTTRIAEAVRAFGEMPNRAKAAASTTVMPMMSRPHRRGRPVIAAEMVPRSWPTPRAEISVPSAMALAENDRASVGRPTANGPL